MPIPHINDGYEFNINGCLFCGVLAREHGLRYDRRHPRGVHNYVAPTNEIRKARLKWRRDK